VPVFHTFLPKLLQRVWIAGDARAIANRTERVAEYIKALPNGIVLDDYGPILTSHGRWNALMVGDIGRVQKWAHGLNKLLVPFTVHRSQTWRTGCCQDGTGVDAFRGIWGPVAEFTVSHMY
jgi:hypothetical protein